MGLSPLWPSASQGIALPLTTVGRRVQFVPPLAAYFGFLVIAFLAIELAKQAFYTRLASIAAKWNLSGAIAAATLKGISAA
jgi:hypothetical protein